MVLAPPRQLFLAVLPPPFLSRLLVTCSSFGGFPLVPPPIRQNGLTFSSPCVGRGCPFNWQCCQRCGSVRFSPSSYLPHTLLCNVPLRLSRTSHCGYVWWRFVPTLPISGGKYSGRVFEITNFKIYCCFWWFCHQDFFFLMRQSAHVDTTSVKWLSSCCLSTFNSMEHPLTSGTFYSSIKRLPLIVLPSTSSTNT